MRSRFLENHIRAAFFFLFLLALPAFGQGDYNNLPQSVRSFLDDEQDRISRKVDTMKLMSPENNFQDPFFAPEARNVFNVESYWLDASINTHFEGEGMSPKIRNLFFRTHNGVKQVLYLVHPESKDFFKELISKSEKGPSFKATSTSSSRTLLMWTQDGVPFFGKLSLAKEIGGVVRTIPKSEVARSIGGNNMLMKSQNLPSNFSFFPEVISVLPRGFDRGGMIIREVPEDILEGRRVFRSLFTLYATPKDGSNPYLIDMIHASGEPASEFIRKRILKPFAEQWMQNAIDHGFTTETHAQNGLYGVGKDSLPTGEFRHRDLGGFDFDLTYRKNIGIVDHSLPFVHDLPKEYHQSDTLKAMLNSLDVHFSGGFLYNIDQMIPKWMQEGRIPKDPQWSQDEASRIFLNELELAFKKVTGTDIKVHTLYQLTEKVRRIREQRSAEYKAKNLVVPLVSAKNPSKQKTSWFCIRNLIPLFR